jgi:hypothetical protein
VISYFTWQELFDGAPDVLGRSLRINGLVFEVAGVASRAFAGLLTTG